MKQTNIPIPARGKAKSFLIASTILLTTSLACGAGVGLAFRSTFWICVAVISPLVLMVLCLWATHLRLYRGAKSGMNLLQLLKYAVMSDEYRSAGYVNPWSGVLPGSYTSGKPNIGPFDSRYE